MKRALIVGPFRDECRARVHHPDEVDADIRRAGPCVLLQINELLADREPPAAERRRPVESRVSRVVELALPGRVVRAACGPVARRRWWTVARNLDVEPRAHLRAEALVLGAVG